MRLASAYAFRPTEDGGLGLDRLQILVAEGNEGSQRVARAVGATEVGRDRRCYHVPDGTVMDCVRFDLLHSDLSGQQPG